MELNKLVQKFRVNVIADSKLPLENYREHNALVKRNNKIVDTVFDNNLKHEFFEALFNDQNPIIRLEAAVYSEMYEYDLKRSLVEYQSFVLVADSLSLNKDTQAGLYKFSIEEYAIKRIKQKIAGDKE